MTKSPVPASRRRMERALSRLKPIEREVLILSASESLCLAEIALRLGISVDATQRHLGDALYCLDRMLERRQRRCWWGRGEAPTAGLMRRLRFGCFRPARNRVTGAAADGGADDGDAAL